MKLCRLLCLSLLLCFVFPTSSYADQLEDAKAAIQNEDFEKAYELLGPLAEKNNAEAQFLLGSLYVNGHGVEKDDTKGLSWIMKAARQGYDQARLRAFSIHLELANQGDARAMYNLGYMCLNGWGGEQDSDICIGWLECAAKNGHVRSAKVLSGIYTEGKFGINPDEEKASYWSNLATAFAAGIDGKWRGKIQELSGYYMQVTYDFKADGDTLTGTYDGGGPGDPTPIKDGRIEGTNISFTVEPEFSKFRTTVKYTGVLLGDELKLSYTTNSGQNPESPTQTFIVKRIK